MLSRRKLLKLAGATAVGGVALSGYAFGVEPMLRLDVTRYAVQPAGWPDGLSLRIAAIADLHACEPWMDATRIAGIVARTNALKPDMIVLLGDFAANFRLIERTLPPDEISEVLRDLKAPLGVHTVLGNHDWWDDWSVQRAGGGIPLMRRSFERRGLGVLENDVLPLEKAGHRILLAGLGDQWALVPRGPRRTTWPRYIGRDDLPGTLAKLDSSSPAILLAHEPDIFAEVPARVALTLSGHTHGGQIRLAGFSPIIPSRYGRRYAYGHIVEEGRNLIVSGGLGCSGVPVRLGVPPEIVLVEIAARTGGVGTSNAARGHA